MLSPLPISQISYGFSKLADAKTLSPLIQLLTYQKQSPWVYLQGIHPTLYPSISSQQTKILNHLQFHSSGLQLSRWSTDLGPFTDYGPRHEWVPQYRPVLQAHQHIKVNLAFEDYRGGYPPSRNTIFQIMWKRPTQTSTPLCAIELDQYINIRYRSTLQEGLQRIKTIPQLYGAQLELFMSLTNIHLFYGEKVIFSTAVTWNSDVQLQFQFGLYKTTYNDLRGKFASVKFNHIYIALWNGPPQL